MEKLSNAGAGRYTIKWIFTEPDLKQVLKDIQIEVGREVTVMRNSFGQIHLRSGAGSFILETEVAAGITV